MSVRRTGRAHNDLLAGNVLVHEGSGEVRFIDYEYGAPAPAAFDVAYFLSGALRPEVDDATTEGILRDYHEALTGHGVILGTAAYMSPEQARGKKIDQRTDIWAFGAILFEMLAGERIFHGEPISELL